MLLVFDESPDKVALSRIAVDSTTKNYKGSTKIGALKDLCQTVSLHFRQVWFALQSPVTSG